MKREDCYWYSEDIDMGARLPFCGIQKGIDPLESCDGCKEYHCKSKRTNADRIRAMSDEELAALAEAEAEESECDNITEQILQDPYTKDIKDLEINEEEERHEMQ